MAETRRYSFRTTSHRIIQSVNPEQHGFPDKHSCLTDLLIARVDWIATLDNDLFFDAIFIDLSKAFDKVSHLGLKQKLSSFGITGAVKE